MRADLQRALEAADAADAAVAAIAAQIAALRSRIAVIERDLDELPARAQSLTDQVASLASAAAAAAATATQRGAERAAAQAALDAAHADVQHRTQELDDAQQALQDLFDVADEPDGDIQRAPGEFRGPPRRPPPRGLAGARNRVTAAVSAVSAAEAQVPAAQGRLNAAAAVEQAAQAAAAAAATAVTPPRTALQDVQTLLVAETAELPRAQQQLVQRTTAVAAARASAAIAWQAVDTLLAPLHAAVRAATDRLAAANAAGAPSEVEAARAALADARAHLVGDLDADGLARLMRTAVPLALLPVRVETRFVRAAGQLRLRVRPHPDDLAVDASEPLLSGDELTLGRAYLDAPVAGAQAAWEELAARVGGPRAAGVVRILRALPVGQAPPLRPSGAWSRAALARALPDRWVVLGYRGGARVLTAIGPPVAESLAVGPSAAPADDDAANHVEAALQWMVDFDAAAAAGMALDVAVPAAAQEGFDRLIVLGLRASSDAAAGAGELAGLLAAHETSDGLKVLTRGEPSNVTSVDGAARRQVTAPQPVARVRAGDGSDGDRLGAALGLAAAGDPALARVPGAGAGEHDDARAMRALLWEATWEYQLGQLLAGVVAPAGRRALRRHFIDHVDGGGALPALRAGSQPYGVLPVATLDRIAPGDATGLAGALPLVLSRLREAWREALPGVPVVTPGGDDLQHELPAVLGLDAISRSLRVVSAERIAEPTDGDRLRALALLTRLGLTPATGDSAPPLADVAFTGAPRPLAAPAAGAARAPAADATTQPPPDPVAFLRDAGFAAIRDTPPTGVAGLLLRHAALRAYAGAATRVLARRGTAGPDAGFELGAGAAGPWAALDQPVAGLTTEPLSQWLDGVRRSGTVPDASLADDLAPLLEFQAALGRLAGRGLAELDGLVRSTLDVCSHRLDAWISSLAARALDDLRAARPGGLALGAYGWVEDLRPAPAPDPSRLAQAQAAVDAARARLAAAQPGVAAAVAVIDGVRFGVEAARAAVGSARATLNDAQDALDAASEFDDIQRPAGKPIPRRPPLPPLRARVDAAAAALALAQAAVAPADQRLAAVAAQLDAAQREVGAARADVAAAQQRLAEVMAAEQDALRFVQGKGHIHAPSLAHATTAAVLRSGYLAHSGESDATSPLAVDVSSRRVRLARALTDGVRQGQPLGALLGYRFERGLHEGHAADLGLERYINAFRRLAPLDARTEAEEALRLALADQDAARDAEARRKDDLAGSQGKLAEAQRQLEALAGTRSSLERQRDLLATELAGIHVEPIRPPRPRPRPPSWKLQANGGPEPEDTGLDEEAIAARARAAQIRRQLQAIADQLAAVDPQMASWLQERSRRDAEVKGIEDDLVTLRQKANEADERVRAAQDALSALQTPPHTPADEALAASSVVDGLALLRRYRAGAPTAAWTVGTIPFGDARFELPALDTDAGRALLDQLRVLDDALDALADLTVAESVHQLAQGNHERSGAVLDAFSRGDAPPPDLEVSRTPRTGLATTHRLVVLLDPSARTEGWPGAETSVRGAAEPVLDAWAARLLGPAARFRVRGEYVAPDGGSTPFVTDLSVLRLAPLDIVAIAGRSVPDGDGELEQRLLEQLAAEPPPAVAAGAEVRLAADATGPLELGLGLEAAYELARGVRELLSGARGLRPADLLAAGDATLGDVDADELAARASAASKALTAALDALAKALEHPEHGLRPALALAAALGVAGATPPPRRAVGEPLDGAPLVAQAVAVLAELERRVKQAAAAPGPPETLEAALGSGFAVAARFVPAGGADLDASFADSVALQGGDPTQVDTWLARASRVRLPVARLATVLDAAQAVDSPER
ncbi:MAG TPA: hypothetical protein VGO80_01740, partial [Solirubrobacteraceae bacterium]|nr:hypothetical protein [Solirubrobacteraceae bacterium]